MQIVQELCRRPGLNKCGFEMPTIYIPNLQKVRLCCSHLGFIILFNYIQFFFSIFFTVKIINKHLTQTSFGCILDNFLCVCSRAAA